MSPRPSPTNTPKAVVLVRESDRILRFLRIRQPLEAALKNGRISRSKIAELWILHPPDVGVDQLTDAARTATDRILKERLVTPLGVTAGMLSAAMEPSCSKAAAQQLLHHLVSHGDLERLGLLTANNDPHLAVYRPSDGAEVARQLQHVMESLRLRGSMSRNQLLEPLEARAGTAWVDTVIGHAEFVGWGRMAEGVLHAWPQPARRT